MDLPPDNPLARLLRELREGAICLEDAVARIRTPTFARQLSDSHLSELDRAVFSGDLGEEEGLPAFLLFEAARASIHLSPAVRREVVLHFAHSVPPGQPWLIGLRREAFECALHLVSCESEPSVWVEVATYVADCLGRQGNPRAALDLLEKALAAAAAEADLALTLNSMGNTYWRLGQRAAATTAYGKALPIYRCLVAANPGLYLQHVAITLNNLGPVFTELGDFAPARDAFAEAAQIFCELARTAPQPFGPELVKALTNLGSALLRLRKWDEAREAYEKALTIAEGLVSAGHGSPLDVAMVQGNLGNLFSQIGKVALARSAYEASIEIYRRFGDAKVPSVTRNLALCLINLAGLLSDDPDGQTLARRLYRKAGLLSKADPLVSARCLSNSSVLEWRAGNRELATHMAATSVGILENWLTTRGTDSDYYSFKSNLEASYHILLEDRGLDGESQAMFQILENLRQGELLSGGEAGSGQNVAISGSTALEGKRVPRAAPRAAELVGGGPEGFLRLCPAAKDAVYLTIQRTVEGTLFTILDRDGFRSFRVGGRWSEAAVRLVRAIGQAFRNGSQASRLVACAGKDLWDALPDQVQQCLGAHTGPVYLSPDDLSVNLPLEFLCPSGEPDDFLGLIHLLPRTPGVLHYSRALKALTVAAGHPPTAMIFCNPTHSGVCPLPGAAREASVVGKMLSSDFQLAPGGRVCVGRQATLEAFLKALASNPSIIHFSGHGDYASREPVLLFAGNHTLTPRGLPDGPLNARPLVMLNACIAGITENMGGAYRGFPEAFLSRGAAAVIASAFPVSDWAASTFSQLFYERFSNGATVGESILHARKAIGQSDQPNPLHWGLYVAWGNVNARLEQSGSSTGS